MREYQHPTPLVRSLTLGLASAEAARKALETVREYRYNPHQPRDARGRWTTGDSSRAASTARAAASRHEEAHPDSRTPEPPSDSHAPDPAHSARSGLKAHLHLVAAHVAYAVGNHAAAAHHLARAEHHLSQASAEHGVKGRVKTDMEGLKGALKAHKHSAADLTGLRVYAYDPSQPRDHTGKWTSGAATAEQHEQGANHHAARRLEAKEAKNTPAAARHHTSQLFHELAAAHKGGKDTELPLKNLSRAMDTLHVQYREAKERNKPQAEIDEKRAAYDHFNEQFKALKKAVKGKGDFPALTHYGAGANMPAAPVVAPSASNKGLAKKTAYDNTIAPYHDMKIDDYSTNDNQGVANAHAIGAAAKHLASSYESEAGGEGHDPASLEAAGKALAQVKPHLLKGTAAQAYEHYKSLHARATGASSTAPSPHEAEMHSRFALAKQAHAEAQAHLEAGHLKDATKSVEAARIHLFATQQAGLLSGKLGDIHAEHTALNDKNNTLDSKIFDAKMQKRTATMKAQQADANVKTHLAAGIKALKSGDTTQAGYHLEAAKADSGPEHADAINHLQKSILSEILGEAPPQNPTKDNPSQNGKTPSMGEGENPSPSNNKATGPALPHTGKGNGDGSIGAAQLGGGFGAVSSANTVNAKWDTAPYHKEVQAAAEAHKGQWQVIPKGQGYHAAGPHAEVTLPDGGKLKIRHNSASSYPTNSSGKIKTGATTTTHTLTMQRYDPSGKLLGSDEIRQHKTSEYKKEEGDKKDAAMYRYIRDKLGINPGSLGVYAHGGAFEDPASYAMRHTEATQHADTSAEDRGIHTGLALAHQAVADKNPKAAKEHLAQLIKDHGAEKLGAGKFAQSMGVLKTHLGM